MQKLSFTNSRGDAVVFNNTEPYLFWQAEGIGLPAVETLSTQSPGQDGYSLHGLLLESRRVKLTGHVIGKKGSVTDLYLKRRELIHICNPLLGCGVLVYENDAGRWEIPAFCKELPYNSKIRFVQTLAVTFECPSPFWQDAAATEYKLAYVDGGLEFPVQFPGFFGTLGYRALINNDGDVAAPIEMYIDGGAVNPSVTNITTGEFIRVQKQMTVYEKLYINTEPALSAVELVRSDGEQEYRENAFEYLSSDSTLFSLGPGVNILIYESDDNNKRVRISILYRKRYAGV